MLNLKLVRERLKQKLSSGTARQELLNELHLKDTESANRLTDAQLEERLSPKLLGLLSLRREDLNM